MLERELDSIGAPVSDEEFALIPLLSFLFTLLRVGDAIGLRSIVRIPSRDSSLLRFYGIEVS